jgi:ribosomal protein S21
MNDLDLAVRVFNWTCLEVIKIRERIDSRKREIYENMSQMAELKEPIELLEKRGKV